VAGEECNEHTMAHKVADEEDANSFTEEADMGGRERA